MNLTDSRYTRYAITREMLQTVDVFRRFDPAVAQPFVADVRKARGLFLTGEGSSRIFPAKRAMYHAMKTGFAQPIMTEGATQALEYDLSQYAVFGASNSGKTKEVVRLFTTLKNAGHRALFGLTANSGTILQSLAARTHVLGCGKEDAVAATKSVLEQALFYDALLHALAGTTMPSPASAAADLETAMTAKVPPAIVDAMRSAQRIYFAGRNTGVAEELTLKTNEITRKSSDFLEGTYAVHGIEEVMDPGDVVVVIDPFPQEEEKFTQCLVQGVGMKVVAVSSRPTSFPTLLIPAGGAFKEYVEMAAGWNLLLETGIALGIDLDKPTRARKVGNEYMAK